jgi:hypothetical protein
MRPLVGHDVKVCVGRAGNLLPEQNFFRGNEPFLPQVSDLWRLRDFWEWLAPGYSDVKTRSFALQTGAFVSYAGLSAYRDFRLELETGSTSENPRVGMWAKAYMTSPAHVYIGTLITGGSVNSVTKGRTPPLQQREVSDQKVTRESKVLEKLSKASRGPYKEQFSEARLADAMAMCKHQWQHFDSSGGKLGPHELRLPAELAAQMRVDGKHKSSQSSQSLPSMLQSVAARAHQSAADVLLDATVEAVPCVKQKDHVARALHGWSRGPGVDVVAAGVRVPISLEEFRNRPVRIGCMVATRPAASSKWAESGGHVLKELEFWVWRVTRVFKAGDHVPGWRRVADGFVYEAHLFQPQGPSANCPWKPCFIDERPRFLTTETEKRRIRVKRLKRKKDKKWAAKRSAKRDRARQTAVESGEPFFKPVVSYLRPDNIVGGGWGMTPSCRLPSFVAHYYHVATC